MIRREDVLPWFEKLDKQIEGIPTDKFGYEQITAHGCQSFQAWMAEAATAIGGVLAKWQRCVNLLELNPVWQGNDLAEHLLR
jgi:hypothetical protein